MLRTQRPRWLKAREGTTRHLLLVLSNSASLALVWKTVTYTLTNPVAPKYPPGVSRHICFTAAGKGLKPAPDKLTVNHRDKDGTSCITFYCDLVKFPAAATSRALTGATPCTGQCLSPAPSVSANTVPVNSRSPEQALNPLHRHLVVTNEAVQQEMWVFSRFFCCCSEYRVSFLCLSHTGIAASHSSSSFQKLLKYLPPSCRSRCPIF